MPIGLAAVLVCGPPAPAEVRDGTVAGGVGRKLDAAVTARAEKGFAGVVLAARGGQVLLAKGYGLADREKNAPFAVDTVVDIGSVTKPFTAAAVLRLEADGKLKLDDPLGRWVPGVPADKRGVTLHHLLTHTAGFAHDLGGDYDPVPRDEFVRLAVGSKLKSDPGATHSYSNVGYSLLGAVVEAAAGRGYERYLADNLFGPAGMTRTGYLLPTWDRGRVARGYRRGKDWGTPLDRKWAADGPGWHLRANGGLLSTVGDLYRWDRALAGDAVLPGPARDKYQAPHVREGAGSHYAYGWAVGRTAGGKRVVGHNGGNGVFFADLRRYPEDGAVLIAATNAFEFAHLRLLDGLEKVLFER